jgi:hypothetical protein
VTGILLTLLLLILALAALYVVACLGWPLVEQFWAWLRAPADVRRSPYELAPDPVAEHFESTTGSIYVQSDHPRDCAKACCWEIRLNEMVAAFDWPAYEHEMRKTK